jgi:uncharacterized protein with von Willebrand factor type A (vWA) domain
MLYRYSRWDGTQPGFSFDPDDLMRQISDDLLDDGDLRWALQKIHRWGAEDQEGNRIRGLQHMLDKLREMRRNELERHNLDSVFDEIQQKLDDIVDTERRGIERRLEQALPPEDQSPDEGTEQMREALKLVSERKLEYLENLPPDAGGRIKQLSDYEFMDADARQKFQQLMEQLRQQIMSSYFEGMKQQLQDLDPADLQPLREMVRDLNKMLQERLQGRDVDFEDFKRKHGHFFPPDIDSLDDLIAHLQQQMAQMQSLMKSMSPQMRESMQQMLENLLRDDRLKWDLAQLAANLEHLLPMQGTSGRYRFQGPEPVGMEQALQLMGRIQQLDNLERQIRRSQGAGGLDEIDAELLEQLLGEDSREDLENLQQLAKLLEDAGYVQKDGDAYRLTAKAIRRIGQKALHDIFSSLKRDAFGRHETQFRGFGGERTYESKRYEFGDPFHLDLRQTLMNAVDRSGPGSPVALSDEDFEVHRTEYTSQCSTVLMVDMSRSMVLRGCFLAAKKVAMALDSLIRSQFPHDDLHLLMFSDIAREIRIESLPVFAWDDVVYGTNMQHGFLLARQLLGRRKGANRQIIMITDGEPTAHLENGRPVFAYPPTYQTYAETLKAVSRCTRDGILINTFMLQRDHYLSGFVDEITKINRGRTFYATPDDLGEYVIVDYVKSKRRVAR